MRYVRVTAPAAPVVSVAEARAQGIGKADWPDSLVERYIAAATEHFDGRAGILGRALVNQSWRLDTAAPDSCGRVKIDMPNVSSLTSVIYLVGGVETTWDAAEYRLGSAGNFYFVEPRSGFSWPSTDDQENAIRVTFVAGYGPTAADVPSGIWAAVVLLCRRLFNATERNLMLARDEIPGVLTRQFVVSEAADGVTARAIADLTDKYRIRMV